VLKVGYRATLTPTATSTARLEVHVRLRRCRCIDRGGAEGERPAGASGHETSAREIGTHSARRVESGALWRQRFFCDSCLRVQSIRLPGTGSRVRDQYGNGVWHRHQSEDRAARPTPSTTWRRPEREFSGTRRDARHHRRQRDQCQDGRGHFRLRQRLIQRVQPAVRADRLFLTGRQDGYSKAPEKELNLNQLAGMQVLRSWISKTSRRPDRLDASRWYRSLERVSDDLHRLRVCDGARLPKRWSLPEKPAFSD